MPRIITITDGAIEDGEGRGDGAYDLLDVSGTPAEIGHAIAASLALVGLSGGSRDLPSDSEPLYLSLRIRIQEGVRTRILPNPRALAVAFVCELEDTLTGAQMREVRRRNRRRAPGASTCASHDFCDANMVMAAAWEQVTGQEALRDDEGEMDERVVATWNRAWAMADRLLGGTP